MRVTVVILIGVLGPVPNRSPHGRAALGDARPRKTEVRIFGSWVEF